MSGERCWLLVGGGTPWAGDVVDGVVVVHVV